MSIQLDNRPNLSKLASGSFHSAYSIKHSVPISFSEDSPHTRQEFKDECDINVIMRRYQSTGELPHLNTSSSRFLDVSASLDFQSAMNYVAEAQSMFAELPSFIRDRFYNDPGQFIDFCGNPDNRRELAQMGLLSPEATRELLYPSTPNTPSSPPVAAPPADPEAPKAP